MKKYDVNKIKLQINEVELSECSILFRWSSGIGWGEYSLWYDKEKNEWKADTELMDSNEDKAFGRKLFELLMDDVTITN